MKKQNFVITGMTCSACSSRVEKCVSALDGTSDVSVNLLTNSMRLSFDEDITSEEEIMQTVIRAGYGATVKGPGGALAAPALEGTDPQKEHISDLKRRIIISLCFLIPLMYISMHHMIHSMTGIPAPAFVTDYIHGDANSVTFAFSQFLLLLPIVYLNRAYFQTGFKTLIHRSPNMDSLIAVGSSAAILYGIFVIFRLSYGLGHGDAELVSLYSGDVYFESAGMILTLITVGKYLEAKSKGRTSEAIEKLMDLAPKTAIILKDGAETEIPVSDIREGDIFILKPGAAVPADGIVTEGNSGVDESAITGESIPVEKSAGDRLIAATINKTGYLRGKALRVGEDTTLSQIIRLVEEASSSKAPIAKMADRIAGIFVPAVMSIALIVFILWMVSGASFEFALSTGIAVLVISCPCALGLATPVAIMAGTGKGAENGILIKSGEALEIAHNIDTVVLDKTGTVTEGRPVVTDVIPLSGISEEAFLRIAVSVEKPSEHPLAEAIINHGAEKNIAPVQLTSFSAVSGRGVRASIGGKEYLAGNAAFAEENGISVSDIRQRLDQLADQGKTPLIFTSDREILGIIAAADVEKENSRKAVELFHKMNIDVIMLTGDNARTAKAIQQRTGIRQVIAEVLPEEKEKKIAEIQSRGHTVAMIGDGINDAPALARADVGIAIGAGTDVAIESADIVLMKSDLLDAVTAVQLSKAVIRNIRQNLFWAFFYNCIGIPLAAGAFYPLFGLKLSPMFGAAAMSLSSFCVVSNALRLKLFKPDLKLTGRHSTRSAAPAPVTQPADTPAPASALSSEPVSALVSEPESAPVSVSASAPVSVPESAQVSALSSAPVSVSDQAALTDHTDNTNTDNISFTTETKEDEEMLFGKRKKYDAVMQIEGMMCHNCERHVREALDALEGVQADVDHTKDTASLRLTSDVSDELLTKTVEDQGYKVLKISR